MLPISSADDINTILQRQKIQRMLSQAPPVPEALKVEQFPAQANVSQFREQQNSPEAIGQKLDQVAKQVDHQDQIPQPPQLPSTRLGNAPIPPGTEKALGTVAQTQEQPLPPPLQKVADPGQFLKNPYGIPPTQIQEQPPQLPPPGQPEPKPVPMGEMPQSLVAPLKAEAEAAPVPMHPEVQKLVQKEEQRPMERDPVTGKIKPEMETHGWKKFGDVMAGIGTGILFRNPWMGKQMYAQLHEGPYRDKMKAWGEEMTPLVSISDELAKYREAESKQKYRSQLGNVLPYREALMEAQEEAARSGADLKRVQAINQTPTSTEAEIIQKRKEDLIRARLDEANKYKTKPATILTTDGRQIQGQYYPSINGGPGGFGVPNDKGQIARIPFSQIAKDGVTWEGQKLDATAFAINAARAKKLAETGEDLTEPEIAKIKQDLSTVDFPGRALSRTAKKQAIDEKAAEIEPENIARIGDKLADNPASIQDTRIYTKSNLPLVEPYMMEHWGVHAPTKASPTQANMYSNALTSLNMLDTILQQLRDTPELREQMGPIAGGLIGAAEARIGSDIFSGNPRLAQEASRLRANLATYKGIEASMLGQRGATQYLIQLVETVTPSMRMEPNRFMGAMRGFKDTAESRLVTYGQQVYGQDFLKTDKKGNKRPQLKMIDGQMAAWDEAEQKYRIGGLK